MSCRGHFISDSATDTSEIHYGSTSLQLKMCKKRMVPLGRVIMSLSRDAVYLTNSSVSLLFSVYAIAYDA